MTAKARAKSAASPPSPAARRPASNLRRWLVDTTCLAALLSQHRASFIMGLEYRTIQINFNGTTSPIVPPGGG